MKTYGYDVYGKVTSSSGSAPNEFDFAGQQTDPTGLQYLRARYYDPETGRFLSRDPLAREVAWADNPYTYAGANPAVRVDPFGLCWGPDVVCDKARQATNAVTGAGRAIGKLGKEAGGAFVESLSNAVDALQALASVASGAVLDAIGAALDAIADVANLVREKAQRVWNACTNSFAHLFGCAFEFAEATAIVAVGTATAVALIAACVAAPPACVVAIPSAFIVLAGVGFALYGYYRVITADEHDSPPPPPGTEREIRSLTSPSLFGMPEGSRAWNLRFGTM